jgi:hypothetical protein
LFGFTHLRSSSWLNVLIYYALSDEIFTMFKEEWVVARLWCIFSSLDWCGSVVKTLTHSVQDTASSPLLHREKKRGDFVWIVIVLFPGQRLLCFLYFCWFCPCSYHLGPCHSFQDAAVATGRTLLILRTLCFDPQGFSVMQLVWFYWLEVLCYGSSQAGPIISASAASFPKLLPGHLGTPCSICIYQTQGSMPVSSSSIIRKCCCIQIYCTTSSSDKCLVWESNSSVLHSDKSLTNTSEIQNHSPTPVYPSFLHSPSPTHTLNLDL